jgi:CubicO group peptidase (beta-lactamase class C family)
MNRGRRSARGRTVLAGGVAIALLACLATGPWGNALLAADEPVAPGPTDAAELEIWLDGLVPALLETHHIPGAVAVFVRDGAPFFSKGYGHADLETRREVDPAATLFRVASVSKLFTTTAVMQQVEAGRLNLNADVNDSLEAFRIDTPIGGPVTLANLLTHTPGFDDKYLRTSQPLDASPVPLGPFLAREMPEQVLPPGDLISYSNFGLALAGYLVERASGQRFEDYIRERILQPLDMTRSRFGIPSPVPANMAVGYEYEDGRHRDLGYDRSLDAPAGDLITTGDDMARFMLAHLGLGALGETRILAEETARMMQSRQHGHDPRLPGWCYGFYEGRENGLRTVEHGGAWRGFGTELTLIPEHGAGLFVSTNLEYTRGFFRTLRRQFFDRYYPGEDKPRMSSARPGSAERTAALAGTYLSTRRVRNSILKLGDFMFGTYRIGAGPDGELVIRSSGGRPPRRMVEVEEGLYREIDGEGMATFRTADDGSVTHILMGGLALEKMGWRGDPTVHGPIFVAALILFGLTALGWLFGFLMRIVVMGPPSPIRGKARFTAFLVCVCQSVFLLGGAAGFSDIDVYQFMERIPGWMTWLLVLPLISLVLTLPLCYFTFRGYHKDLHDPLARLHYGAITIASIVVLLLEWHWNLLGYHF